MRVRVLGAALAVLLAGCVAHESPEDKADQDGGDHAGYPGITAGADSDGLPAYRPLPAEPAHLVPVTHAAAPGGYRVWAWNDTAYVATFQAEAGVVMFNISSPEAPVEVGRLEGVFARGVDVLNYGRRTVITAPQGGPFKAYDVTDPAEPVELVHLDIMAHNDAVHRPAFVVYNSRSLGPPPGGLEIIDARNPDDIRLAREWEFPRTSRDGLPVLNPGCHDVVVYPDVERAYCAAITQTLVWDTHDPWNPEILTVVENPAIESHHSAFTILNHTVLVISDEAGDGFVDACFGTAPTPAGDQGFAFGGLWFYDNTKVPPALLGRLDAPPIDEPNEYCSSHNGWELGRDTGFIVYGWIGNGVVLIDARDPTAPRIVDLVDEGGAVWDAFYYRGYVYTADEQLGLGVYRPE